MKRGVLLIVSGPSGAGKGTVLAELCRTLSERGEEPYLSVSMTTRYMREGEEEGKSYFFTDRARFEALLAEDGFLEHNCYNGEYYGTPREPVERALARGQAVLFDIDINGARQIRAKYPDAVTCFLVPPRFSDLEERLRVRGTETEEKIAKRLAIARGEYAANEADYIILNDTIGNAAAELLTVIGAARLRRGMREDLLAVN